MVPPFNCVLVSSVKSSLNTAPKCSIFRSNNKTKFSEKESSPLPSPLLQRRGGHPPRTSSLQAPWRLDERCSLCLLPPKLKSGYAVGSRQLLNAAIYSFLMHNMRIRCYCSLNCCIAFVFVQTFCRRFVGNRIHCMTVLNFVFSVQ